jgi:hypothetical protein
VSFCRFCRLFDYQYDYADSLITSGYLSLITIRFCKFFILRLDRERERERKEEKKKKKKKKVQVKNPGSSRRKTKQKKFKPRKITCYINLFSYFRNVFF